MEQPIAHSHFFASEKNSTIFTSPQIYQWELTHMKQARGKGAKKQRLLYRFTHLPPARWTCTSATPFLRGFPSVFFVFPPGGRTKKKLPFSPLISCLPYLITFGCLCHLFQGISVVAFFHIYTLHEDMGGTTFQTHKI